MRGGESISNLYSHHSRNNIQIEILTVYISTWKFQLHTIIKTAPVHILIERERERMLMEWTDNINEMLTETASTHVQYSIHSHKELIGIYKNILHPVIKQIDQRSLLNNMCFSSSHCIQISESRKRVKDSKERERERACSCVCILHSIIIASLVPVELHMH